MRLNSGRHFHRQKKNFFKLLYPLAAIILLSGHDLYIKMETYFLNPGQKATLSLYNGTFEKSENIITRDRMIDASVVGQGKRSKINAGDWKDQDSTITKLSFETGNEGTYVAGVSTKARNISLSAEKFNDYLKHDGVLDMLEKRKAENLLDQDAVESYQKHVKAIYQVGEVKTNDWSTRLGYPIEFVPQTNPYESFSGGALDVLLLLDGKPLANQLVFADYIKSGSTHSHNGEDHSHSQGTTTDSVLNENHTANHSHATETEDGEHSHVGNQQLRTNKQGLVTVNLPEEGIYYLRTIHMTSVTDKEELTHRSKWATLSFEVGHQHGEDTHTHAEENSFPTFLFVLGSLLVIGILFFIFRKRS